MADNPDISIVIPTYNRKALIQKCLESLSVQSYPKSGYEIIVVDDGSTDGTPDLLESFKSRYANISWFRQENKGMYPAWNSGSEKARGRILVFIDSDCVVEKSFVESIASCFSRHPDIAVHVGCEIPVFQDGILSVLNKYLRAYPEQPDENNVIASGNIYTQIMSSNRCAMLKTVFFDAGGFDKKYEKRFISGGDTELGLAILRAGFMIRQTKEFTVYHYQRQSLLKIIERYYNFGFDEPRIFKNFFKDRIFIRLPFARVVQFSGSPFPLFINIGTVFEILAAIIIISVVCPSIGMGLLILYLTTGIIGKRVRPFHIPAFLLYKILSFATRGASFAGNVVGSIRYGIIYL